MTDIYHFNLGTEGLAYLGILIGALITIPPYFWYLHKFLEPQFDENGEIIPIPFVLIKFGPTLRRNYSRHARKDL